MRTAKKISANMRLAKPPAPNQIAIPGPDELNEVPTEFLEYFTLIYGTAGIGKTSLCASFPGAIVFQFEPARRNLPIRMVQFRPRTVAELQQGAPNPWQQLFYALEQLEQDDSCQLVVIDNIVECYKCCENDYLAEENLEYVPKKDFGHCRGQINARFESLLNNFKYDSRLGCIFTAHTKEREAELNTGTTETIYGPACSTAVFDYLKRSMDFAFYFGYHNEHRALHVRWDCIWTKCGTGENFLDSKTKEPLKAFAIPSDGPNAWKQGAQVVEAAFKNQIRDCSIQYDDDDTDKEERPKIKRKKA